MIRLMSTNLFLEKIYGEKCARSYKITTNISLLKLHTDHTFSLAVHICNKRVVHEC
ncbi:hypothetical protein BDC45DRAFT_524812 [Circinella umbellata]|nr:hypothetical protein BDC45DRAFT_524812 [Circinella umbellata]